MVLIGRITKDATVKKVKDHHDVVNFAVAVNDFFKPKGATEGITLTTYYNCSYWLSTKIARLLTKGTLVEVHGRVSVNAYMGFDEEPKASLNCHVNNITVHQHKKKDGTHEVKDEIAADLPF